MKTQYEYITFTHYESKDKTEVWQCSSVRKGFVLGYVKWYGGWKQYSFFPSPGTLFNRGCLADIQNFLKEIMQEARERQAVAKRLTSPRPVHSPSANLNMERYARSPKCAERTSALG